MDRRNGAVKNNSKESDVFRTCLAVLFWLFAWQALSLYVSNRILIASPVETLVTLGRLFQTMEFWKAVGSSFAKLVCGFFLGMTAGIVLAVAAFRSRLADALISPVLCLIKAVPVASFIILALLWVSSEKLSVLISFLMVVPVIYTNVLTGIRSTSRELLEMAEVFSLCVGKRLRYIYLPAVLPYFVSACSVSLGFCFKSGIAAEIIGLPDHSIGEKLYEAKLYLMTGELFAWTAVIVLLSVCFERIVMLLIRTISGVFCKSKKSGKTTDKATERVTEEAGDKEAGQATGKTSEKESKEAEETAENATAETAETAVCGLFEVSKSFPDRKVLEHFTLTIEKNSMVALLGPSGSGKSTAGKLLLGLLTADAGTVRTVKPCGAVFQEDRLCTEFDAETNVMLVNQDRALVRQALLEVGLGGLGGKPVAEFSGGMKRRVAIVRALLSDAAFLVLDEPFTGLDEESRERMIGWVKERISGRQVLLITHREEEAVALAGKAHIYVITGGSYAD